MKLPASSRANSRGRARAFTLVELIVAMSVLLLLVAIVTQMFGAAQTLVGRENARMDTDSAARGVFDRMAIDFAQMFKRPDVDYYLKSSTAPQAGTATPQLGNDQIAFYSQVPGYASSTPGYTGTAASAQSPLSLVAYRVCADSTSPYYNQLQRFGYGLVWNGIPQGTLPVVAAADTPAMPVIFASASAGSNAITKYWPVATNMVANPCYEAAGRQVFRLEYSYLLKGSSVAATAYPPVWSDTPWDTRASHTAVNGLRDVAAIRAVIAVIDARGQVNVDSTRLNALAGSLCDFSAATTPNCGDLETAWEAAILQPGSGIPSNTLAAMRVYGRTFYLPPGAPNP